MGSMTNIDEKKTGFWACIHGKVKEFEPWGIIFAVMALIVSIAQFTYEFNDRVEEREVRAWQLLTTKASGNSGKITALQHLNREDGQFCFESLRGELEWLHGEFSEAHCILFLKRRIPLTGIDLSPPNTTTSILHQLARQEYFLKM